MEDIDCIGYPMDMRKLEEQQLGQVAAQLNFSSYRLLTPTPSSSGIRRRQEGPDGEKNMINYSEKDVEDITEVKHC